MTDLINISVRKDVFCNEEGWIEKIHTRELGLILIELGGGRKQVTDKIDYGVGYDNVLNIGDEVNSSTPLLSLYSSKNIDDNLIVFSFSLVITTITILPYRVSAL